jgi:predicted RNase H-like nuclease
LSPALPIAGVDGCPAGWYAVQLRPGLREIEGTVHARFDFLLQACPAPACVAVDIPIGLRESGERACDQAARERLGARASSVFAAPLRGVLGATSHEEASARRRAIEGKGMSIQAYNILRKVEEVDAALRAAPVQAQRVHETHPEVCFLQMNAGQPLAHGKKTAAGRAPAGRAPPPRSTGRRRAGCAGLPVDGTAPGARAGPVAASAAATRRLWPAHGHPLLSAGCG